jgi:hypothetical protein
MLAIDSRCIGTLNLLSIAEKIDENKETRHQANK